MRLDRVGVAEKRLQYRLRPPTASPVFVGLLSVIILHCVRPCAFRNSLNKFEKIITRSSNVYIGCVINTCDGGTELNVSLAMENWK